MFSHLKTYQTFGTGKTIVPRSFKYSGQPQQPRRGMTLLVKLETGEITTALINDIDRNIHTLSVYTTSKKSPYATITAQQIIAWNDVTWIALPNQPPISINVLNRPKAAI